MRKALSKKNLWENSPGWVKTTVGQALGLFPVAMLLGRRFQTSRVFAQQADKLGAQAAREYQLHRLREVLALAYEKSGFYRAEFDRVGFDPAKLESPEGLSALPTIDKNAVVENQSGMLTRSLGSGGVDYVSTGGTSGRQLRFYINSERSAAEYAYLTASWERCGYRLGMPMAVFRGQIVRPDRDGLRHEYDPILRRHYYSNFHMDDESIHRYLKHLEKIGPCCILAYPSAALALAQHLLKLGKRFAGKVEFVLAGSENVYQDQRQIVEEAFGCRFFSWYGHSEKLVLAAECENSPVYHVWPTYGYCELLAEDGSPVRKVGQRGEIVGTGFINTVMPFIRYRTGDYAVYAGDRCEACGREVMLLRDVEGRWPQGDLVGRDGGLISMTAVNVHDKTFEKIRDYQFRQTRPGHATLAVIPAEELSPRDRTEILEGMNRRLQGQVVLELEVTQKLVRTARGKALRVLNEIPGIGQAVVHGQRGGSTCDK